MESQNRNRRVPIRPRPGPQKNPGTISRRRIRINTRRNRQILPRRNRLERAQNNQNRNGRPRFNQRFRRFNNFNRRRNYQRRTLFVGGLPRRINNIDLLRLFRPEGRIISYRVMKNREGFSRGFGFVEFANPRDAWKSIQKWNNSFLDRNIIKVQFRRRVFNQRGFRNNNFNNRNNGRFNQGERGERNFGFRGERGGFRAGARPRGRF
jgi:hypothetical protein